MRTRFAVAGLLAVGTMLYGLAGSSAAAPRAHAAVSPTCGRYAHEVGALLTAGGTALTEASHYIPLIERAAKAGLAKSSSGIKAVAAKITAINGQIANQTAKVNSIKGQTVADGKTCAASSSKCAAFTVASGEILIVVGKANIDASKYVPLIQKAAKAGLDKSAREIGAVATQEKAITATIVADDAKLNAIKKVVLADEAGCRAS